eukprot:CAMPEP_0174839288 /NCGR_PEP_ID=MMETSP1114-20130205/7942_1 /TAXON_ID=312471 /ORGANISM="Neobodo designis, Strain CCAP 1951/1" /LENGTH=109 /DNA_ID=CAMNT_0016073409 /DNA_START=37 /DNA_END=366 /DNA_ORIENTATION=+
MSAAPSPAAPRELHSTAWRLEVPVASRTSADAAGEGPAVELQLNLAASTAGRATGADAAAADTTPAATRIETEWVRLDYAGLVELAATVDAAVAALDDASYRSIHRRVK